MTHLGIFLEEIIIKYFEEDLAKKEMIDYIYELQELMMNSEKIWVDITGGKRDLPIFVVQLLNLIVGKSYKKNNIEILYTKEKDRDRKIYETISLKDFLDKLDYTDEISAFSKYACPMKFMESSCKRELKVFWMIVKTVQGLNLKMLTSSVIHYVLQFLKILWKRRKWKFVSVKQVKLSMCLWNKWGQRFWNYWLIYKEVS